VITSVVVLAALGALGSACRGSPSNGARSSIDIDREPIRALAGVASSDAQNMERHAATMKAAAAARPAHAHWASDADIVNADARSLRFLADSALAIANDPGSTPWTSIELRRVLGDGLNLQRLGETLLAHADAMDAHLQTMREQARGEGELIGSIDLAGADIADLRRDGQAAIDRGKELQNTARRIAENTGQKLDEP
jgi:hypothetical protein